MLTYKNEPDSNVRKPAKEEGGGRSQTGASTHQEPEVSRQSGNEQQASKNRSDAEYGTPSISSVYKHNTADSSGV